MNKNRVIAGLRIATKRLRVLPSFIIIGAQKAGTTSLFNYLIQHPAILAPSRKETHFFDKGFHQGPAYYRAYFPTYLQMSLAAGLQHQNMITGEASPYYLFHPHVPARVRKLLPGIKLIVLLRNPVDRAYSHYHHAVRLGYETKTFEEAIEWEPERLAGEVERLTEDEYHISFAHQNYSYLARGLYADQLTRWFALFDRRQILILETEELEHHTADVYNRVIEFLGLPPWTLNTYKRYLQQDYQPMHPQTRERLIEYFDPHNRRLYKMLGRNYGWDTELD